jgi:hypothetical protein
MDNDTPHVGRSVLDISNEKGVAFEPGPKIRCVTQPSDSPHCNLLPGPRVLQHLGMRGEQATQVQRGRALFGGGGFLCRHFVIFYDKVLQTLWTCFDMF